MVLWDVQVGHKEEIEESEKKGEIFGPCLRTKKSVKHESDGNTNCTWCTWKSTQRFEKKDWKNWKSTVK